VLILALDTATDKGSLALMAADQLLAESSLESRGTYLTRLLPEVEALFRHTGRQLAEIGAVAVSRGPGNFTGLRIGLATAKALAWSLNCPLVAVPTMEALAAQFPCHPDPIGVLLDAKRNEVFWGLYRCPADLPQELSPPERLPLGQLRPRLTPPLTLTGPGLKVYGDFLEPSLPLGVTLAPLELREPRAASVARLGRLRLALGLTVSPAQLIPTYLRPAL
jgi:tRNA threonylcarbamoyladenosine biosynthesis protein TsaB